MIVGGGWVRLESEDVEQEEAGRHHEHGGEGGRGGRADHQHLPDPGEQICMYHRNLCTRCLQKSDFQNAGGPTVHQLNHQKLAPVPLKRFSKYYSWWDFGFLDTRHREL